MYQLSFELKERQFKPTFSDVDTAIEVMNWFENEVDSGSFYGWGIGAEQIKILFPSGKCGSVADT